MCFEPCVGKKRPSLALKLSQGIFFFFFPISVLIDVE